MRFGLFPGRSPLLGESFVYFLFLQVLRCFSSLRLPLYLSTDNHPSGDWVVPFGNLGIRGYLHLPQAYRSLSRPSSPPRAKASTRRPNFLSPFTYIIYFNIQRKVAHTISCNLRFNSVKKTKSFTYSLVCQYVKDLCEPPRLRRFRACVGVRIDFTYAASILSHAVENNGFEPLTPCLQSRCSSQLS